MKRRLRNPFVRIYQQGFHDGYAKGSKSGSETMETAVREAFERAPRDADTAKRVAYKRGQQGGWERLL